MKTWRRITEAGNKFRESDSLVAFFRKAGTALVIQVLGAGLGYLLQVFLARVMGEQENGLYIYIIAWASIGGMVCNLGLPGAALRFLPEYSVTGEWGRFQGLVRGGSRLTVAVGIGLSLVATLVVMGIDSKNSISHLVPILFGIWMMPLLALESLQSNLFRGGRQILAAYGPSKVLRPLLFMIGITGISVVTGASQFTSVSVLIVTFVTYLILILSQQLIIHRDLLTQGISTKPIYDVRTWLRVSLPLLLITGFMLILYQTDVLMIGAMLQPKDVALYNAAAKTSSLTGFIYSAVEAISAPTIAALYAAQEMPQMQRLMTVVAHIVFWPTIIISIVLMTFSGQILSVFGPEFVAAKWTLIILVSAQVLNSITGSGGYLLDLTGHQDLSARVRFCTAGLNVGLNFILIPQFGIMGAAIATSTATVLDSIVIYIITVKSIGIHASIFTRLKLADLKSK